MRKAYRIISIEAADIYRQEQENGGSVGCKMPESKSDAYFVCLKSIWIIRSTQLNLKRHISAFVVKSFLFKIRAKTIIPLLLST